MEKIANTMRQLSLRLIKFYQYWLSPLFGQQCRFYPSCSEYAKQAIQHYGLCKGLGKTIKRLLCCQPWHPGGHDPISKKEVFTKK
jgi:putative membrane protein insertion efficiency factor